MQFKNIGFRVCGLYAVAALALREANMSATAEQRRKVLAFWDRHGIEAAMDHAGVCRSTLHAWRAAYRKQGAVGLASKSRAPRRVRRRNWPLALLTEIRRQRQALPNMGPGKLHETLKGWCAARQMPLPSARTIGRLIADAPDKMRFAPERLTPKGKTQPRRKAAPKLRRPNLNAATPGECVAFDTIVLFVFGLRRYILTATDHHSRFAFAIAVPRANSKNAAQFAALVQAVFPAPIRQILTDNGSEFAGAFDDFAKQQGWRHNYTYPKCPKMNARNERFNRTVQEEFVNYEENLLADDIRAFNDRLLHYLGQYNTQRPPRNP